VSASLEFINVDPEWVRSCDLVGPVSSHGEEFRCYTFDLPSLGWTVLNFVAPKDKAMWFFRVYKQFDAALRGVFYAMRNREVDDVRRKNFEKVLRKLKIPFRSDIAFHCFGMYPRLWGRRYLSADPNPCIFFRHESVAIPSQYARATREYFTDQQNSFGPNSLAPAMAGEPLFVSSRTNTHPSARLLLKQANKMDAKELQDSITELSLLVHDSGLRSQFVRLISDEIKFAGVLRGCHNSDLVPGSEASCRELAILRVRLACALGWPHLLEYVRQGIAAEGGETFCADLLPEIDRAVSMYPVVLRNPLSQ